MTNPNHEHLDVATTFTFGCNTCGATVQVIDTVEQPHRCRVVIASDARTVCPECEQGKHGNCDGTAWDDAADAETACTCGACKERAEREAQEGRP